MFVKGAAAGSRDTYCIGVHKQQRASETELHKHQHIPAARLLTAGVSSWPFLTLRRAHRHCCCVLMEGMGISTPTSCMFNAAMNILQKLIVTDGYGHLQGRAVEARLRDSCHRD